MNTLRDSDGDLWEVLPESGYVPQQDEIWVRYQDDEMRAEAQAREQRLIAEGVAPGFAEERAWADTYAERGHARVFIREVPHEQSTGDSFAEGPRGVYEVLGWVGRTMPGSLYQAGGLARILVRPGPRWYAEQRAAAERDLENLDPEDPSLAETRAERERAVDYNRRAYRIASMATAELPILEMNRRIEAERAEEA